jgi:hypothetical protein
VLEPHSDEATLLALDNESDLYSFSYGSHPLQCEHTSSRPDPLALTYGCCAVLSFLGMYWSPILCSVVYPGNNSLVPPCDLQTHPRVLEAKSTYDTCALLGHVEKAFSLIHNETKEELFNRIHHHLVLPHPMPGLRPPSYSHYQCNLCCRWTSRLSAHIKKYPSCAKLDRGTGRHYTIALYPVDQHTESSEFLVRLDVPDLAKRAEPDTFSTIFAPSPNNTNLVAKWMEKNYKNPRGSAALKLHQEHPNVFSYVEGGITFRCLHGDDALDPIPLYTGCAVLSFFQLYFSPILQAIVSPRKHSLLYTKSLQSTLDGRVHGIEIDVLLQHILSGFHLPNNETPQSLFDRIHKNLTLSQPLLGLPSPTLQDQCPICHGWFSSRMDDHLKSHPGVSPRSIVKKHVVTLWQENKYKRFKVRMDDDWANLSVQPVICSPIHTYLVAPHLEKYGYAEHVKSWNVPNLSPILQIADLPSKQTIQWPVDTIAWKIEQALVQIHSATGQYLEEANVRINSGHSVMRRAVVSIGDPK